MTGPSAVPHAGAVVIDCADLDRVVGFWSALLEARVTRREAGWADLEPLGAGGPILAFQRVPERKNGKNRLHLDLEVQDLTTAARRARTLGATPAGDVHAADGGGGSPWQVWRDPEGNEFCLCTCRN